LGSLVTQSAQWSKFTVATPLTPMLLLKFTDGCGAVGFSVEAAIVDKAITI
jgi:hypothetical protein